MTAPISMNPYAAALGVPYNATGAGMVTNPTGYPYQMGSTMPDLLNASFGDPFAMPPGLQMTQQQFFDWVLNFFKEMVMASKNASSASTPAAAAPAAPAARSYTKQDKNGLMRDPNEPPPLGGNNGGSPSSTKAAAPAPAAPAAKSYTKRDPNGLMRDPNEPLPPGGNNGGPSTSAKTTEAKTPDADSKAHPQPEAKRRARNKKET